MLITVPTGSGRFYCTCNFIFVVCVSALNVIVPFWLTGISQLLVLCSFVMFVSQQINVYVCLVCVYV